MDYSLITEQNIQKRYHSLPEKLRSVLDSEKNAELVNSICNNHYLKDGEKIVIVEQLVALVILGFIEFEELKKEISENLNLNIQHSTDIVSEINKKIFEPVKSDIENNYKPVMSESLPPRQPMAEVRPKPFSPLDVLKEAPAAPKPQAPMAEIPVSKPIVSPAPLPVAPKPPVQPSIEKKDSLPSAAPATNGPLIIHKEAEFKPLSENKKSLGGFFNFLNKGAAEKKEIKDVVSPVKAKVEIGPETFGVKKEMENKFAPPRPLTPGRSDGGQAKAKIVHYSDVSSSVSANPFSPIPAKPAESRAPEVSPKPTLRDMSKPVFQVESKPSFEPKPLMPSASFSFPSSPVSPSPVRPAPSVPPIPPAAPKPAPVIPPVLEKPKEPEESGGNVIDLRSFK